MLVTIASLLPNVNQRVGMKNYQKFVKSLKKDNILFYTGVADTSDNCQFVANPGQEDSDGDNHGDACDNCVNVFNNPQTDTDENKVGDACDTVGGTNKDK